ncbi:MAG: DUF6384 family protein [Gammaproteobacteria bacterium]|jgi:hypothetical protein
MSANPVATKPPLDEVMLAMDIVDTLRHRERIVERALSADERDRELVERLREIYAGQGIEVSDAIIERGVRDLREDRFVYTPPKPSLKRWLARRYVGRDKWKMPVVFAAIVALLLFSSYQVFIRGPEIAAIEALPRQIEETYIAVAELAEASEIDTRAESMRNGGRYALQNGDIEAARTALADLEELYSGLSLEYELRVLSRPGELSGVWRVPASNPGAQNFYLIVEAIDPDGDRVPMTVVNEETGVSHRVTRWGQRVEEATFQAVAEDKQDDGIIQSAVIGEKRPGVLEADLGPGVLDGAITDW